MRIDRRRLLGLLTAALGATPALSQGMSRVTAYAFSFAALDGGAIRLADDAGKPILIVNTASQCGYTPQYAGLQQLWTRFHARGLLIVAVPSNDYGQEPGGDSTIETTTHQTYGVTFPVAQKVDIKGAHAHPFYKWAALERPLETPRWNFHKYLIGRDGRIAATFPSDVEPGDARVVTAISRELGAGD
jgi:glutathione peroxidase